VSKLSLVRHALLVIVRDAFGRSGLFSCEPAKNAQVLLLGIEQERGLGAQVVMAMEALQAVVAVLGEDPAGPQ
jgi:hypothetical protein